MLRVFSDLNPIHERRNRGRDSVDYQNPRSGRESKRVNLSARKYVQKAQILTQAKMKLLGETWRKYLQRFFHCLQQKHRVETEQAKARKVCTYTRAGSIYTHKPIPAISAVLLSSDNSWGQLVEALKLLPRRLSRFILIMQWFAFNETMLRRDFK